MHPAEKLNNVGLKATTPRLKVLQVFHAHERRHLTAEDVHRRMVEQRLDIGLATVYRVLGQLTEVGILSRNSFESGGAVYELHQDHHHDHLICLQCGRVDEFTDATIEQRQRSIAESSGYAISQHQLALYGFCPECRNAKQTIAKTTHKSKPEPPARAKPKAKLELKSALKKRAAKR